MSNKSFFKKSTETDSLQSQQITALDTRVATDEANITNLQNTITHDISCSSVTTSNSLIARKDIYAESYICTNDYIQANGDAYLGNDLSNLTTLWVDKANNKVMTSRGASIEGFKDINITGDVTCNTLNYTTLSPAIPQYTPHVSANTYYVAKSGNDTTGNGSLEKPYLTIQKAVNIAELAYNGTAKEIKVGFGSYVETITIKKSTNTNYRLFSNSIC
jgi:hypothetical protein